MKTVYGVGIYQAENKIVFEELKNYEKKISSEIKLSQNNLKQKITGVKIYIFINLNQQKQNNKLKKTFFSKITITQKEKEKSVHANPVKDYFYFKLCFSSWKNYLLKIKNIAETDMNMLELMTSSESDENDFMEINKKIEENMHFPSRNSENNIR